MKSPFKFLDSYTKDDREIFFGRDREIEELYQKVFDSKLLLVYGVSGTGKSSLIQCGLANKFRETDWLPIVVRRGGNIIESLAAGIRSASLTPLQGNLKSPAEFKKGIRSLYLDYYKPVFFIFDQFEELFIFGTKEEDEIFISIIQTLISSDIQSKFIFILREEYLGWLSTFEKSIPGFFNNRMRVEKMNISSAKSAIEGPCKIYNINVEDGFAENMIQKLCPPKESEIELTYLQVYLDKVFKLASEGSQNENYKIAFRSSDLEKAGNVYDILGSFLDEQISQLPDPELAMAVLKAFVSARGTKRPANAEEVKEYTLTTGKDIDEKTIGDLLHSLVNLRILQDKDHTGRNELKHDALALKIYEKITLIEKELIEIRQLIENAYSNWKKRGVLISSEDLQYIAPYESRLYLPAEYGKLIEKSKKELIKARHRRRKILSAAAILLFIILGGFTLWAVKERKNAIEKEKIATEERIKATASENEAIIARDYAIESDKKAVASEKEALQARDEAKASELRVIREKEIAEIRERQARANNFNYLSKEILADDPTIALRLAEYALSLDPDNKSILNNLNRIYYDNSFYKIFFKYKTGNLCQISSDWTKIISTNARTAIYTDLKGNNIRLLIGHLLNGFTINDAHGFARRGYDNITSLAISMDGNSILTGSNDKTARLWDINGNIRQVFNGHILPVSAVAISPDGKTLLTGSADLTARLWDLQGKCLQVFSGHKSVINSVTFSPGGKEILTGSADSTAILWDLNGKILHRFVGHEGAVRRAIFANDGNSILTGSNDQTAKLWDPEGNILQSFNGHTDNVVSLAFSPDGKTILTGSADKTARLWDLNGNSNEIFKGHTGLVTSVIFSSKGNSILTFCIDGIVRIWDLSQNSYKDLVGHKNFVYRAIFSPDGKTILTLSKDQTLKLWDTEGNNTQTIKFLSNAIAFSPDEKTILSGLITAQLIDLKGNVIKTFIGHTKTITSVAFSPDGKMILTGSMDKTARLWDLEGKTLRILTGHSDNISSVAFSPDGKSVITGSNDNTTRLWDLNGNLLQIFVGHTNFITGVVFSPDGRSILTGSDDKTARLWDLNGNTIQIFSGHSLYVNSVSFAPDGKSIITGSGDRTARVWDLNGSTIQIIKGFKTSVYSVSFSPDNKSILIGSGDNSPRLTSVKIPLNSYFKENTCENLNLEQMLKYEIGQIKYLSNENEIGSLFEGLEYILFQIKLQNNKRDIYLKEAEKIFRKTGKNLEDIDSRKRFITNGMDYFKVKPLEYLTEKIADANQTFLSSTKNGELKEVYDFYSEKCSYLDSTDIIMKMPDNFIKIAERLYSTDTTIRKTISIDLSGLSWPLLQNRRFNTSMQAISLALEADSTNQYIYITLPLVLLLNDRFEEASRMYLKYYKKSLYNNYYGSYKLIYLGDINDLEKKGITHPDFERVRELLKN